MFLDSIHLACGVHHGGHIVKYSGSVFKKANNSGSKACLEKGNQIS